MAMLSEPNPASHDLESLPMPTSVACNTPVSLAQMLDRREARCANQQDLLARFGHTLVQLTLVSPGPVKDTAQTRFVFATGQQVLRNRLAEAGFVILAQAGGYFVTGPEILIVIDAEPLFVKDLMLQIEEHHALGRLWDIDVLDPAGASISRQQLGWPARRCLLCDQSAHACARSSQHTLADLQHTIGETIEAFCNSHRP